jgi:hypothetical protein
VKEPSDVAVGVHEKHTRYARVLFDQAIERSHVAAVESVSKFDRQRG